MRDILLVFWPKFSNKNASRKTNNGNEMKVPAWFHYWYYNVFHLTCNALNFRQSNCLHWCHQHRQNHLQTITLFDWIMGAEPLNVLHFIGFMLCICNRLRFRVCFPKFNNNLPSILSSDTCNCSHLNDFDAMIILNRFLPFFVHVATINEHVTFGKKEWFKLHLTTELNLKTGRLK